jgi:cytochrome c oxidase subunit 2
VELSDGSTVVVDEAYVRESILTSQAKIVKGFQPLMPTFQGLISEEGLVGLIEHVRSLSPNATTTPAAVAPAGPTGGTGATGTSGAAPGRTTTPPAPGTTKPGTGR